MLAGDALPEMRCNITRQDLVRYAGAANDYLPQHWDQAMMQDQGFADVLVHGWLGAAHLARLITSALTPESWTLNRYSVRYRKPLYPGAICCGGTIINLQDNGIEIDGWIKNSTGETVTTARFWLVAARS